MLTGVLKATMQDPSDPAHVRLRASRLSEHRRRLATLTQYSAPAKRVARVMWS